MRITVAIVRPQVIHVKAICAVTGMLEFLSAIIVDMR